MTLKDKQITHTYRTSTNACTLRKNRYGCDKHECLKYLNIYKAG